MLNRNYSWHHINKTILLSNSEKDVLSTNTFDSRNNDNYLCNETFTKGNKDNINISDAIANITNENVITTEYNAGFTKDKMYILLIQILMLIF